MPPSEFGNFMGGIGARRSSREQPFMVMSSSSSAMTADANRWDYTSLAHRDRRSAGISSAPLWADPSCATVVLLRRLPRRALRTPRECRRIHCAHCSRTARNFSDAPFTRHPNQDPATGSVPQTNVIRHRQLSSALLRCESQFYPAPLMAIWSTTSSIHNRHSTNVDKATRAWDWTISEKDRLFGRYSQSNQEIPTSNSTHSPTILSNNAPTHNESWIGPERSAPPGQRRAVGVNYVRVNPGSSGNLRT